MKRTLQAAVARVAVIALTFCVTLTTARAQAPTSSVNRPGAPRPIHATGTFEVTLTPQPRPIGADSTLGRQSSEKRFHGDIEGDSRGEMLTAMTNVRGSAGYVAFEQITGSVNGRRGTFVLQHIGTMNRGVQELRVIVVPDSGTDGLAGLAGTMVITITNGVHFYDLEYTIEHSS